MNPSPVDGIAERLGDHITVKLTQPVKKPFNLDGSVVFPTEQIQHIIAAARDGKSVLEQTVYDGSDNGEKVYNTLTVIGRPITGDRAPSSPDPSTGERCDEIDDALAGHRQLFRSRRARQGRRTDAGLFDGVRALRERRLSRAGAGLQRFRDLRRAGQVRRQGSKPCK